MPHGGDMIANGTIACSRFVVLDTVTAGTVTQAGNNTLTYGISGMDPRRVPLDGLDANEHCKSGEMCQIYRMPEMRVPLEYGATVAIGDKLRSDTNGKGVAASSSGDKFMARALQAGVSGDIKRVEILSPSVLP